MKSNRIIRLPALLATAALSAPLPAIDFDADKPGDAPAARSSTREC